MQFLLFDVSATFVFLLGYLTVVNLQATRDGSQEHPMATQPSREWPRLSAPR